MAWTTLRLVKLRECVSVALRGPGRDDDCGSKTRDNSSTYVRTNDLNNATRSDRLSHRESYWWFSHSLSFMILIVLHWTCRLDLRFVRLP